MLPPYLQAIFIIIIPIASSRNNLPFSTFLHSKTSIHKIPVILYNITHVNGIKQPTLRYILISSPKCPTYYCNLINIILFYFLEKNNAINKIFTNFRMFYLYGIVKCSAR